MRSDIQQDPVEQLGSLETELHTTAGDSVKLQPQRANKYPALFQDDGPELPDTILSLWGAMLVGTGKAIKAVVGQCLRKKLCQLKKPSGGAGSSLRAFLPRSSKSSSASREEDPFLCLSHSSEGEKGLCCLCVPSHELR